MNRWFKSSAVVLVAVFLTGGILSYELKNSSRRPPGGRVRDADTQAWVFGSVRFREGEGAPWPFARISLLVSRVGVSGSGTIGATQSNGGAARGIDCDHSPSERCVSEFHQALAPGRYVIRSIGARYFGNSESSCALDPPIVVDLKPGEAVYLGRLWLEHTGFKRRFGIKFPIETIAKVSDRRQEDLAMVSARVEDFRPRGVRDQLLYSGEDRCIAFSDAARVSHQ